MDKKLLFGGLAAIFVAANLLYWLPVFAQESSCPPGKKCIFNDSGTLLLQVGNGDIELSNISVKNRGNISLDTSKIEGDIFLKTQDKGDNSIYLNYFDPEHFGLGVAPDGSLYHDGLSILVADGNTYGISVSGSSQSLGIVRSGVMPNSDSVSKQLFFGSSEPSYLGSTSGLTINGLGSVYSDISTNLSGQLAFIREGDQANGFSQYLQLRFNNPTSPKAWGDWREVCDSSNNCRNFLNILDETSNGSLLVYQDPYLLMESGLKISDPNALSDCGSLTTVNGVIGCGSVGGGGGVAGSGTINYLPKWSNTSTLSNSLIYDNGNNVGISTTSLTTYKLAVAGTGYFSGTVQVAAPTQPGHAVNKDYLDTTLSALGGSNVATFAGISSTIFTGNQGGYDNVNVLCAAIYPASHICTAENILAIINNGNASTIPTTTTGYWISNGPPGYTVNANDCAGFNSNSNDDFGTVWIKISNSNNFGALQPCGQAVNFACCK